MHTLDELRMKQALPLPIKIRMTQERIMTWYHLHGGSVYLSFSGGKDSTVLKSIVDDMGLNIPSVFVDTGLEYPEVRSLLPGLTGRNITDAFYGFFRKLMRTEYQFVRWWNDVYFRLRSFLS